MKRRHLQCQRRGRTGNRGKPIGKKVEVLVIAEDNGDSLEDIRDYIKQQEITESMIKEAIEWARK